MTIRGPVHRDIEKELLSKERKHRRPNGQAVYCFPYTKEMVDFDNWDHMFQTKYCFRGGLTMNQFETPPLSVLDLGCGGGLWVIEAAKQWKDSKIVGFDFLSHLQPKVGLPEDIAQRIEWVQGNFLEPLPFPANHFDFVRGCRLSFHVPEDEGSFVLEEVYRIVKPGGILEAIEEDLIFPHARISPPPRSASQEINNEDLVFPSDHSIASSIKDSVSRLSWSMDSIDPHSLGTDHVNPSQERLIKTDAVSSHSTVGDHFVPPRLSEYSSPVDPRDHSQLQMAWDVMLQKRFLVPCYTSVCLLYFQGTYTVKSHPLLQIPLPPNSSAGAETSSSSSSSQKHPDTNVPSNPQLPSTSSTESVLDSQGVSRVSPWASMHLARTVRTVMGCKENIWEAYLELFGKQLSARPFVRSSSNMNMQDVDISATVRDAFESAWSNWETDMQDRIGFRGNVLAELMWPEPPGDTPDWRIWRDSLKTSNSPRDSAHEVDLCRSMRAIVGWKV